MERNLPLDSPSFAKLVAGAVLLLITFACLVSCHRDRSTTMRAAEHAVQPYVFLDHLGEADRSPNEAQRIHAGEVAIRAGDEPARAMFAHASSAVVFHAVTIPAWGRLRFSIGIDEAGWAHGGDGAAFGVSVRTSQGEDLVFSRRLSPQTVQADRGWTHAEVDLQRFGAQQVDIIFQTDREANEDYDWCWWANPVLAQCSACGPSEAGGHLQETSAGTAGLPSLVALISIDTLRADALSCYGNERVATPNLDALARDGVRFAHAIAQDSWTIPSHASLLTSLYPVASGARADRMLPARAVTLAEVLRAQQFATVGIVNHEYLSDKRGFNHGFDEFHQPFLEKGASTTITMALDAIRRRKHTPLFLFLHLFDVHGPYPSPRADLPLSSVDGDMRLIRLTHLHDYLHPERYRSVAAMQAAYESGVPPVDAELGRLFSELKRLGLYGDALLVVVADHGEGFFEHGVHIGHGLFAYDTDVAVPMIFKFPRGLGAGTVVQSIASLVDVLPTILNALGFPALPTAQGESLLPRITEQANESAGDDGLGGTVAYGYTSNTGYTAFVRTARWKYIEPPRSDVEEVISLHLKAAPEAIAELRGRIPTGAQLYDLQADPGEHRNVVEEYPAIVNTLRTMAMAQRQRDEEHRVRFHLGAAQRKVTPSDAEREQLRRLGYGE